MASEQEDSTQSSQPPIGMMARRGKKSTPSISMPSSEDESTQSSEPINQKSKPSLEPGKKRATDKNTAKAKKSDITAVPPTHETGPGFHPYKAGPDSGAYSSSLGSFPMPVMSAVVWTDALMEQNGGLGFDGIFLWTKAQETHSGPSVVFALRTTSVEERERWRNANFWTKVRFCSIAHMVHPVPRDYPVFPIWMYERTKTGAGHQNPDFQIMRDVGKYPCLPTSTIKQSGFVGTPGVLVDQFGAFFASVVEDLPIRFMKGRVLFWGWNEKPTPPGRFISERLLNKTNDPVLELLRELWRLFKQIPEQAISLQRAAWWWYKGDPGPPRYMALTMAGGRRTRGVRVSRGAVRGRGVPRARGVGKGKGKGKAQ